MKQKGWTYAQAMRFIETAEIPEYVTPRERIITPEQQDQWKRIAVDCQEDLFSAKGKRFLEWLRNKRGLTEDTIIEFRLGVALPSTDADHVFMGGTKVPRGVTIPLRAHDGAMYGVKVRTAGPDKYRFLPGSKPCLYGPHSPTDDLLVTEGEFDAMLAWQETGGKVDVATVGSSSQPLSPHWQRSVIPYRRVFVVHDNDEAGEKSSTWRVIGRAEHVATPLKKDITEYYETGKLKSWLDELITTPHVARKLNEDPSWQRRNFPTTITA